MPVYLYCLACRGIARKLVRACPHCNEVYPREDKTFRIQFMYKGKNYTEYMQGSKTKAEEIERKMRTELREGEYFKRTQTRELTMNDVWNLYLESYKCRGGKAWYQESNRYKHNIEKRLGNQPLTRITSTDIEKLLQELSNKPVELSRVKKNIINRSTSNDSIIDNLESKTETNDSKNSIIKRCMSHRSVRHVIELVTRLFKYATKMKLYSGDCPTTSIDLPKINNKIVRMLSSDQVKKLIDVLKNMEDQNTANVIQFLMFTGCRAGEAFKLKWDDVELDKRFFILRNPKSGEDKTLPLNNYAHETLSRQKALQLNGHLVFPSITGIQRTNLHKYWRPIARAAGIPDVFRGHDLRHSFASWLASSGKVDLYTLQSLMTHSSLKMTEKYAHLMPSTRQKAVQVLDGMVDDVIGTTPSNVVNLNDRRKA